jgi:putative ABC transport system ATP-binding protein
MVPPRNAPLISLKGVEKEYATAAGRHRALRDIDLEVGTTESVAITGRSGSGKTTLLHLISGVDRPTHGEVRVAGEPVHGRSENALAKWRGATVGIVFQSFQLLPTLTVVENVLLPMDFRDVRPPRERRRRALELLDWVGIADQADKLPSALSGGQQQRAAIARALANDPPIVVADEPTGNLDRATARAIFELFGRLKARGTTLLVATHETELAAGFDRTVELVDGAIARTTAAAELAATERVG